MNAQAIDQSSKAHLPHLLRGLALLALCLLVYWPTFDHSFIWDDNDYVYENSNLHDLPGLKRIWFEPYASPQYYPLVFTALWVEYQFFHDWAGGYHIVTVAFHAAAALLLWLVLCRLKIPGHWWIAAFFAVHPVHVETAAWITEHKNVMSALFYSATGLAYFWFDDPNIAADQSKRRYGPYALSLLLFIMALLCKTVVATLPAVLLLVYWFKRGRLTWSSVWPTVPFFLLGIASGLYTANVEFIHVGASGVDWSLSWAERFILAGQLPWFYLSKLILPTGLCFSYERWPIDAGNLLNWLWPISIIACVGLAYYFRKRIGRGIFAGLCFFGGSLFPVLGFLNVYPFRYSWAADHFNYIASVGALAVVIGTFTWRLDRSRLKVAGRIALAVLLLGFAGVAWARTWQFANLQTLWRHTLKTNPNSYLATINLANMRFGQGQVDQAESMGQRALELTDRPYEAHDLLGAIWQVRGDRARAIEHYMVASKMQPTNIKLQYNLAYLLHEEGRYQEAIDALHFYAQWDQPLGEYSFIYGSSLFNLGRYQEAIRHLAFALKSSTRIEKTFDMLAKSYEATGQTDKAESARKMADRFGRQDDRQQQK